MPPLKPPLAMTRMHIGRARDFLRFVLREGGHRDNITCDERAQLKTALAAIETVLASMQTRRPSD